MSDHTPPVKPKRRGTADGYDPFAWAREVVDALGSQPQPQQSEDELKDYQLFRENEKVRRATAASLIANMKKGNFQLVSEFRYRRPELRDWIDDLERQYWSEKDNESEQWR